MRLTDHLRHIFRPNGRWQLLRVASVSVLVLVLACVGFVGGRSLAPGQTEADDQAGDVDPATVEPGATFEIPGRDVTPEPGSTPDRGQPYWYVPYLNQERLEPKFQGEVAGMMVGVSEGPGPACEAVRAVSGDEAIDAIAGTPMEVNLEALPDGVRIFEPPVANLCADGSVVRLTIQFEIPTKGAAAVLDRVAGYQWVRQQASARRWSEGSIAGRPAAFMDTIIDTTGTSGVFVRDDETGGKTQILGLGITLEEAIEIMEVLYR